MKRVGGAPTASAERDGRPRRRLQPRAGTRAPPRNLRDARRQRRPGAGARRRPPRRDDRRNRTRLRLERRRGSPPPRSRSPRPCRRAASPPPASTSPASGGARKHRLRGAADRPLQGGRCAASTRRPTGASSPPAATMVMLSTAIYPALSPTPAAFARPIATGELRNRLGFEGVSITDALDSVAVRSVRRPGEGRCRGGPRRRRPAPLRRPGAGRTRLAGAGARAAAGTRWTAASSRASAQRVLDLRARARPASWAPGASSRTARGSKTRTPSPPPSFAAYIAVSASEMTDS